MYETDQELPAFMTINELQKYTDNITQNYSQVNGQIVSNFVSVWKRYTRQPTSTGINHNVQLKLLLQMFNIVMNTVKFQ